MYVPEAGEIVRVDGHQGAKFKFIKYGADAGGDFAVVIGGLSGHRIERCVTVDRIQPYRRSRTRIRSVVSDQDENRQRDRNDGDDDDE